MVNFQPVEMNVLEQGQSQGKANAWHQAAFLQELLGKALEDTGTLNQENRHHWETQTGWGIPRALQATTGSVWLLQERVCISVQGTELRDTANAVPRAALPNPDPHSADPDCTGACKACRESKDFPLGNIV